MEGSCGIVPKFPVGTRVTVNGPGATRDDRTWFAGKRFRVSDVILPGEPMQVFDGVNESDTPVYLCSGSVFGKIVFAESDLSED